MKLYQPDRQKMSKVESSTAADPSFLTNPRLFIVVRVTPLNWAEDLCSQDLDLLSTSRKLLVTRVQFAAWQEQWQPLQKCIMVVELSLKCELQIWLALL